MCEAITHFKVPMNYEDRLWCLGPDGSAAHVRRVMTVLSGRWKLPILFRLFAQPSMRASQLLRDISDISQKMLTQRLRELENDGVIQRRDFGEQPPRVEYSLTSLGLELMPVLIAMRSFSQRNAVPSSVT
ncbi:winged helix-turn-helix transcriptional regulator [Pseudorhizobium pelagicum]|uniref:ArsR family transcriptional regulator n=1 Tax=Pseudorhizobium pelagicum TaxID=1509405 RepID=A0A922NX29_9HYPH|nr:helix-turn-helix domain-containing protein [Pseudorhizobium pelagicum]KEQ02904.1 ArsR family transcriptional regulator [Pseudorhizobium pelagicum]KEQ03079.1 ArsR family transcriptional regulator [Pseudorhizobium pelagicum]